MPRLAALTALTAAAATLITPLVLSDRAAALTASGRPDHESGSILSAPMPQLPLTAASRPSGVVALETSPSLPTENSSPSSGAPLRAKRPTRVTAAVTAAYVSRDTSQPGSAPATPSAPPPTPVRGSIATTRPATGPPTGGATTNRETNAETNQRGGRDLRSLAAAALGFVLTGLAFVAYELRKRRTARRSVDATTTRTNDSPGNDDRGNSPEDVPPARHAADAHTGAEDSRLE